jgi:SulP family sulfate permease
MTLAVGPVAVVSLLTGSVVVNRVPDYSTNTVAAVNLAGELSLAVGVILVVMSLFNCGNLIRFVSHPVMSGFTSGAAMMIGLNQVKNAFGFSNSIPQAGQPGYDYNYQVMNFLINNWYGTWSFTANQIKKKPVNALFNGQPFQNTYAAKVIHYCYFLFLHIILLI